MAALSLNTMPYSSVSGRLKGAGLALLCVTLGGCSTMHRWADAAALVAAVAEDAVPEEPYPSREVHYAANDQRYRADLYPAQGSPRAALVLVHGFTEYGKADPRLQRFAASLARARFQVLVPEIPGLTRHTVGTDNIDAIAASLAFLAGHSELRRGLAAISYSVGPAVLAALSAGPGARFILAVGGYHDLVEAISYATTGRDRLGSPAGTANEVGRWLILLSHAARMPRAEDRELLRRIARRKLARPGADIAGLRARLTAEGHAALALVSNRDPDRVAALIRRLPNAIRQQIAALDLARRDLSALDACLVLIHGKADPMIPATHSHALAAAVPPGQARLFVVAGIGHVDVRPGPADAFALWRAAVALLEAAEGC